MKNIPKENDVLNVTIDDMSCTNCAMTIVKQLQIKGVEADVNTTTKKIKVKANKNNLTEEEIYSEIRTAGYTPTLTVKKSSKIIDEGESKLVNHDQHEGHNHEEMFGSKGTFLKSGNFKLIFSIIVFTIVEVPGVLHHFLHVENPVVIMLINPWLQAVLATLVMYFVGGTFFKGAIAAFKVKSTTMDTLVFVGAWSAYIFSWMQMYMYSASNMEHYFFEATIAIITLIYIGHYLEHRSSSKVNKVLDELTRLNASIAHVVDNETRELVDIDPSEVEVGQILRAFKGEVVPLDGIVISGSATINESMISGEPIALVKSEGDQVTGGTIIESGSVDVIARKRVSDGTLSHIIEAVEKAQFEKPAIQKTADKISTIFVPVIITLAIITGIVWYFITKDTWTAVSIGLSVIVISCPCAFGLATPLSILIGSSLAAKRGILYKSGETFEAVQKIDVICFDKTGTITKGVPKVIDTYGVFLDKLDVLYSSESKSEHPLAHALSQFFKDQGAKHIEVNIEEVPGRGIVTEGIMIGSQSFAKEHQVRFSTDEELFINKHESTGASTVFIFEENKLLSILAISDTIKEGAQKLMNTLQKRGINTYMITGDAKKSATFIASQVNIQPENVFANILPVEKLSIIENFQNDGKTVCFVGDGINDAPALAKANLGIAVGTGSKIALAASDVTLVGGNINLIDDALQISKATLNNIYINFAWAFSYNILAIPIAMSGTLSPTWAAFFMAFSDIVVVLSAQTLRFFRKK